jgi:hypothetical protein
MLSSYACRRSRYHCGVVFVTGHPQPTGVRGLDREHLPARDAASTSALDTPPTTERIRVGWKASISSVAPGLAGAETPRPSARRCSEFRPWKQPTSKKKSNVPRWPVRGRSRPRPRRWRRRRPFAVPASAVASTGHSLSPWPSKVVGSSGPSMVPPVSRSLRTDT